jgi:hypothetical protein
MAVNLSRRTVVTAKSESAYGTDPTPTLADDALLVFGDGAAVFTQNITVVDQPALRASLTPQQALIGKSMATVNLGTVLMTASKASDTAGETSSRPFYADLLKACGLTEAIGTDGSSSSTVYTPVTDDPTSATVYVYADNQLHKVKGCYGSYTLTMNAGAQPDLQFNLQGLYEAPTASGGTSGVVYPTDDKTLVENELITIGSFTPKVRSLTLNWATTMAERNDANADKGFCGFYLTERAPTLNVVIEEDDIGTYNPWGDLYAAPSDSIVFTHATSATEKILLTVTNPQLTNIARSSDAGLNTLSLDFRLWSNTDEGEMSLVFKKQA